MKSLRSFPTRTSGFACLALFSLSILGLSCSSGGLQPVSGKITQKGQAIKGATVTLHPKSGLNDIKALRPSGVSDEQGVFNLSTGRDPGAPPGEYVVTVVWYKEAAKRPGTDQGPDPVDQLQGKYNDPKNSKITVTIKAGVSQLDPINVD